jgi:hypothetical protein
MRLPLVPQREALNGPARRTKPGQGMDQHLFRTRGHLMAAVHEAERGERVATTMSPVQPESRWSDRAVNRGAGAATMDDWCRRTAVLAGLRIQRVDEGLIYLGYEVSTGKEATITPDEARPIAAELVNVAKPAESA